MTNDAAVDSDSESDAESEFESDLSAELSWAEPVSYDKVARLKKSSDKTTKCVNRWGNMRNNTLSRWRSTKVRLHWWHLGVAFFFVPSWAGFGASAIWMWFFVCQSCPKWCVQMAHPHRWISDRDKEKFTQILRLTSGLRSWSGSGIGAGLSRWTAFKLGTLRLFTQVGSAIWIARCEALNWSAAPAIQCSIAMGWDSKRGVE